MSELLVKYQQLNAFAQMEVLDFLDFLLLKQGKKKAFDAKNYKKNILRVSVWSEADIAAMEQNTNDFNQWEIKEW